MAHEQGIGRQYGLPSWDERADAAIRQWHEERGTKDPADYPFPPLRLRDYVDTWKIRRAAQLLGIPA